MPIPRNTSPLSVNFSTLFASSTLMTRFMERFAKIRSLLRRQGKLIADFDLLLGTTALHHDLTVFTYNVRDVTRIPELRLYAPA
jgi:predicted nucleic acid-binding protein